MMETKRIDYFSLEIKKIKNVGVMINSKITTPFFR